jgi:hypothetical protein
MIERLPSSDFDDTGPASMSTNSEMEVLSPHLVDPSTPRPPGASHAERRAAVVAMTATPPSLDPVSRARPAPGGAWWLPVGAVGLLVVVGGGLALLASVLLLALGLALS